MIPTLRLLSSLALAAALVACASAPVRPAVALRHDSPASPSTTPNVGKVVFIHSYLGWMDGKEPPPTNTLRDLHMKRATGEAALNLFVDGHAVGHLRAFEYVQVELPYGEHQVQMARPMVVADWKSSARINVQQPLTHVVVDVGWTSGSLSVRAEPVARLDQWHRHLQVRR